MHFQGKTPTELELNLKEINWEKEIKNHRTKIEENNVKKEKIPTTK